MSYQYDQYLTQHKSNVKNGFEWIRDNLPDLIKGGFDFEWQIGLNHDQSKTEKDEYTAYDAYFYGGNRSFSVIKNFRKAWLLHIHRNPHHWQYWVLINDEPEEGEILIEMPYNYILEMVCDWWAFSWSKGDLKEIFAWYDERKNYIKLHPNTRNTIESILDQLKTKLEGKKEPYKCSNCAYLRTEDLWCCHRGVKIAADDLNKTYPYMRSCYCPKT